MQQLGLGWIGMCRSLEGQAYMHRYGTRRYHVNETKDAASLSPEICIESECLRSQLQLRLKTTVQLHCCLHASLQTVQLLS